MLVGHAAVVFAGKRLEPRLSLGTLMAAALLADLLGIMLILLGIEHWTLKPGGTGVNAVDLDSIAWSHGLVPDLLWAGLLAGGYFLWRHQAKAAWILFAAILSHWILDFVSHKPDMPLAPGLSARYGLGLWTSPLATLWIEGGLWLAALVVYVRATRAGKRTGIYVFWPVIAFVTLAWISNFTAAPAAGNMTTAALASLTFFTLLVAWAYWMDRVRKPEAAH
jgi:hypothetical protein